MASAALVEIYPYTCVSSLGSQNTVACGAQIAWGKNCMCEISAHLCQTLRCPRPILNTDNETAWRSVDTELKVAGPSFCSEPVTHNTVCKAGTEQRVFVPGGEATNGTHSSNLLLSRDFTNGNRSTQQPTETEALSS